VLTTKNAADTPANKCWIWYEYSCRFSYIINHSR
jgi:hypothetical protein